MARLFARAGSRAAYRVYQFVHGLRPALSAGEVAEVRSRLSEPEFALFLASEPRDRVAVVYDS